MKRVRWIKLDQEKNRFGRNVNVNELESTKSTSHAAPGRNEHDHIRIHTINRHRSMTGLS